MKFEVTIDDCRLKTNLKNFQTLQITKFSFLRTILGFTESHSGALGDIESFIQMIPESYKSDEPMTLPELI